MHSFILIMTVEELIEALRAFPADAQVLVEGYETGCDSVHRLIDVMAVPNPQSGDWDGEFAVVGKVDPAMVSDVPFSAVWIIGKRGHLR